MYSMGRILIRRATLCSRWEKINSPQKKAVSIPSRAFTFAADKQDILKHEENEKLHSVMESMPRYEGLLANKMMDSFYGEHLSADDDGVVRADPWKEFVQLASKNRTQEMKLEEFPRETAERLCLILRSLSNDQLVSLVCGLTKWPSAPSSRTPAFKRIWNALDSECVQRIKMLQKAKAFQLADLWYFLMLGRLSQYNKMFIKHYVKQAEELSKPEFVHLVFLIGLQRTFSPEWLAAIEKRLLNSFLDFSIEEIGIVSATFFKTRMRMNPKLLLRIIVQMESELPNMKNIVVSSLAKLLHHGNPMEQTVLEQSVTTLLDSSCAHVKNWNHYTCVHMLLAMTAMLFDHRDFLATATTHLSSMVADFRLKDLSKLLLCLSTFNYQPEDDSNVYRLIVNELRNVSGRKAEYEAFPHPLIACLLYLSYRDTYPKELIEFALSPDFIENLKGKMGKFQWQSDVYKLDSSVRIERPEYRCVLSPELRNEVKQQIPRINTSGSFWHRVFLEVKDDIVKDVPETCVCTQTVLDHFPYAGILLHLVDNQFVPITDQMNYHMPLKNNEKRLYVYVGARGCYSFNSRLPLGTTVAYMRQLKRLGFTVVEVPWFEYKDVPRRIRPKYLKEKLSRHY